MRHDHELEYFADLDDSDISAYREHTARTTFSTLKDDVSFQEAVEMQVNYMEFMHHIVDKYGIESETFWIDEITGRVYIPEGE